MVYQYLGDYSFCILTLLGFIKVYDELWWIKYNECICIFYLVN